MSDEPMTTKFAVEAITGAVDSTTSAAILDYLGYWPTDTAQAVEVADLLEDFAYYLRNNGLKISPS